MDCLDILVSNAGIAIGGRITETKTDTWQKALDINVLGSVRGLRVFVPKIGKGGRIVLTASAAGLVHAPAMATYNAMKAATVALGETVDAELRHRKISTAVICPQFFKSGLADSLTGDDDAMDAVARVLLSRTWLTSEIVARRAVKGIEARRTVVTPDGFATFSWYS
ncbi:MAG: SDR family NAD(P)-dependent oxidoreductase, partial [Corynebacterium variabile]